MLSEGKSSLNFGESLTLLMSIQDSVLRFTHRRTLVASMVKDQSVWPTIPRLFMLPRILSCTSFAHSSRLQESSNRIIFCASKLLSLSGNSLNVAGSSLKHLPRLYHGYWGLVYSMKPVLCGTLHWSVSQRSKNVAGPQASTIS